MTSSEDQLGGGPRFNVEEILRIKGLILQEPRLLNMEAYVDLYEESHASRRNADKEHGRPPGNTVFCIAGLVLREQMIAEGTLTADRELTPDERLRVRREAANAASRAFGLSYMQTMRLTCPFGLEGFAWPKQYAQDYAAAASPEERARVTANRMKKFIVTEGRE